MNMFSLPSVSLSQVACCNQQRILISSGQPWDGWHEIRQDCSYSKTSVNESDPEEEYFQFILDWDNDKGLWYFMGASNTWNQAEEFFGSDDPCDVRGIYSGANLTVTVSS